MCRRTSTSYNKNTISVYEISGYLQMTSQRKVFTSALLVRVSINKKGKKKNKQWKNHGILYIKEVGLKMLIVYARQITLTTFLMGYNYEI